MNGLSPPPRAHPSSPLLVVPFVPHAWFSGLRGGKPCLPGPPQGEGEASSGHSCCSQPCPGPPRGAAPVLLLLSWGAPSSWLWARCCAGRGGLPPLHPHPRPAKHRPAGSRPPGCSSFPERRCLGRGCREAKPVPLGCEAGPGRTGEGSEPDLGPGVSFRCQIGQVCRRSQGLGSLFGVEAGRSAANPSSMGLIPKGRTRLGSGSIVF